MRRLKFTYLAAAAILALSACQSDVIEPGQHGETAEGNGIQVHLNVGTANTAATRAWVDTNAVNEEMMNVWTVVAVDSTTNKIVKVMCCKPTNDSREIDDLVDLPKEGTYRFYSFANIHPQVVIKLLTEGASEKETYDDLVTSDPLSSPVNDVIDSTSYKSCVGKEVKADSTNTPITVKGNNFNPKAETNGYGSTGIPMSNVQTLKVTSKSNVDLIVVRLIAKVELRFYNETGADIEIDSVTLTDLTMNTTDNLQLLPSMKTVKGHNTMDYIHRNINTNLNTESTEDLKLKAELTLSKDSTYTAKKYKSFTFYVNESDTPDSTETNQFKRFFLKVKVKDKELRYVLLEDETNGDKWNYISRNDYRIIPIVLDDYKLDIIPYDFPAIGVYPASVKEEDGLYTINFHDYGHFHLYPKVTRYSDEDVQIPYNDTSASVYWTFVNNAFTSSWTSYTDMYKTKTADDNNSSFYVKGSTATQDADDNGGWPALDLNTVSRWEEAKSGDTYQPFIFGKIAEPVWNSDGKMDKDKTIYHELQVQLYKNGTAAQVLTTKILMILDKEQMSASKRKKVIRKH